MKTQSLEDLVIEDALNKFEDATTRFGQDETGEVVDPVALGLIDGSLNESLAYAMN